MKHTNITNEITGEYYKRPFWDFSLKNDKWMIVGVAVMIAVAGVIYLVASLIN